MLGDYWRYYESVVDDKFAAGWALDHFTRNPGETICTSVANGRENEIPAILLSAVAHKAGRDIKDGGSAAGGTHSRITPATHVHPLINSPFGDGSQTSSTGPYERHVVWVHENTRVIMYVSNGIRPLSFSLSTTITSSFVALLRRSSLLGNCL